MIGGRRVALALVIAVLVAGCSENSRDAETASILVQRAAGARQPDRGPGERLGRGDQRAVRRHPNGSHRRRRRRELPPNCRTGIGGSMPSNSLTSTRRPNSARSCTRAWTRPSPSSTISGGPSRPGRRRCPTRRSQGVVGTWFNTIEKVFSVSEPEIFRFERTEFKQAFLDEPDCRNVIQQFVND